MVETRIGDWALIENQRVSGCTSASSTVDLPVASVASAVTAQPAAAISNAQLTGTEQSTH